MEVVVEAGNHAADLAILFVDPERSGELLRCVLGYAVSFGMGVAGEVEGDGAAPVEGFAARVGHLHDGEQLAHADVVLVGRLAGGRLLRLRDILHYVILFLLLLLGAEILAVLLHGPVDFMSVDEEDFAFFTLRFLAGAVLVELAGEYGLVIGVVLAGLVHFSLVLLHLLHEGGHIGEGGLLSAGAGGEGEKDSGDSRAHGTNSSLADRNNVR